MPAAVLLVEYLGLSVLVDLPVSGPASSLVQAIRLATPVALGALATGWLLARSARGAVPRPPLDLGRWRPFPALALQWIAFGILTVLTVRVLGDGAPQPSAPALAGLLALGGIAIALAALSAAPARRLAAVLSTHGQFPLVALGAGLLTWRVVAAAEGLWGVLSSGTLRAVAAVIGAGSLPVTLDAAENVVGLGTFRVQVAPVCSGADGLGLVVLFQAIWIALARDRLRFPRALVLLPAGAAAALAANVLRIAALLWVGASGNPGLAAGGLHSKLGWILFIAIALATIAAAERLAWFRRDGAQDGGAVVPAEAGAYVAPFLAATATAVVTSVWSDGGFDRWYLVRILAALAALLLVRRTLPRPRLSWSWVAFGLGMAVLAAWIPLAGGGPSSIPAPFARLGAVERWAWIAARVAGSCLVVPVVEELAFRELLLRWLVSPAIAELPGRAWSWPAVAASSAAFGALHAHWAVGALAGLAFAAARLHRGRLSDAILAHAVANAGVALAVLAFGRWDLWTG